jgi:hypothetical protein
MISKKHEAEMAYRTVRAIDPLRTRTTTSSNKVSFKKHGNDGGTWNKVTI